MHNPVLGQVIDDLKARYPVDGDSVTYSQWLALNTKLNGKAFGYEGFEFQQRIVDDMHPDMSVIKPSQVGMALKLDTPVPTPTGWTTMGELKVGDTIFGRDGRPCQVTYVSPVYTDHVCYEVEFDDGSATTADAGHRWYVEAHRAFGPDGLFQGHGRIPVGSGYVTKGVITTELMAKTFKVGQRNNYAIPNAAPLQTPDVDLPIDPYFLGLWLGDGNSHASVLTAAEADLAFYEAELASRGLRCVSSSRKGSTIQVVVKLASDEGRRNTMFGALPLKNKHIPSAYLRASPAQRLDLLRGLLDTDGSITARGRVSFHNTDPSLIAQVEELITSLGFKFRTRWRKPQPTPTIKGRKICAEVSFVAYAEDGVFLLPRKRERLGSKHNGRSTEALRRRVVDVRPVPATPVRCIQVNSPDHLFLAGRQMVPTHNTEVQVRKFLAFLTRNRGTSGIFSFPDEKMFKKNSKTRIKPVVKQPVFNSTGMDDDKPTRAMNLYEINGSFAHIMGMTEGDATSTPADILFHDELDLSNMTMIGLYQSRLQNSAWKITQAFSTPTFPMFGIDAAYQASDMHEYMARCECCGHWQVPSFAMRFLRLPGYVGEGNLIDLDAEGLSKIDLTASCFVCERCSKPLNLRNPELREWVAERPSRDARGYRIRPTASYKLDPAYILRQLIKMKRLDQLKGWHNTVLGETYNDGNSKLEPEVVKACMKGGAVPEVGSNVPCALASDMGLTCHLTVGRIENGVVHPFLWEQVPHGQLKERIAQLRAKYNIVAGAVDRHPYTTTANEIRDDTSQVILPVEYRGQEHVAVREDEYGALDFIQINRTKAIDDAVKVIKSNVLEMTGYTHMAQIVVEHLCDMVRIELPERMATWEKTTGADHFMHSLVLLQASIKIRHIVEMTRAGPAPKKLLGLIGVPVAPGAHSQLGAPKRKTPERLI